MKCPSYVLFAFLLASLTIPVSSSFSQEVPSSGVSGIDVVFATDPAGTSSQMFATGFDYLGAPLPLTPAIASVPSRWAHRRRTLGALETAMTFIPPGVILTPMGDAVGNGGIHMFDARQGLPGTSVLVTVGNPPCYDLAIHKGLNFVFTVEDGGAAGNSILRGYSYAAAGQLTSLSPTSLTLSGRPSAYVHRIVVDETANRLFVPTSTGIHAVNLSATGTQLTLGSFLSTAPLAPATNPAEFTRNGVKTWAVGTCEFTTPTSKTPVRCGFLSWSNTGLVGLTTTFGAVPSAPTKEWVPAAGAHELGVVSNGTDTYAYFLLREPAPGTFFVKGSGVAAIRFLGNSPPDTAVLPCSDECGEPFAIPTVYGGKVALETSFGPPFTFDPPGGGERIVMLYSPLDPLGSTTSHGHLAVPGPLGGRISTKGVDRPFWSSDGRRVMATTSWFNGAPNPGTPGIEVLDVPSDIVLTEFQTPACIVTIPNAFDQSIILPSTFRPRDPGVALPGLDFFGGVSHDGMASILLPTWGAIGQKDFAVPPFVQSDAIPNFRAIHSQSFEDATASLTPVPPSFGARRTSFNAYPGATIFGITMSAAIEDSIRMQVTGFNFWTMLTGMLPPLTPFVFPLPAGWITTTEILSV